MSDSSKHEWYVVHTYSGYEKQVEANLNLAREKDPDHLGKEIVDVCIPVEDVVEIKNNKRRVVQRKLLPGYVLVKMRMTDANWYIVRNTRGVTGFVGPTNKGAPLSETDFAAILNSVPEVRIDIQPGDEVRVLAEDYENFTGKVASIDAKTQKVTVVISMLGTEAEIVLDYDQVARVDET